MAVDLYKNLTDFYGGSNYSLAGVVPPPRPSEWHIPRLLCSLSDTDNFDAAIAASTGKILSIDIPSDIIGAIRDTLLHEAIFATYKAFYNYLASKRLYAGGLLHWIEITNYYAKLYLARATITLTGHQKYRVRSDSADFVPRIFIVVNPSQHKKLIAKYRNSESINYENEYVAYTITLDVGLTGNAPSIRFDDSNIDSHRYIWTKYRDVDVRQLGLTPLLVPNGVQTVGQLINDRNRENYSFEGYRQLDFNLSMPNFEAHFERDFVKEAADTLYDETVGLTLLGFQEFYNLLQDFRVSGLPLEREKFAYMIEYSLDDSEARSKLLDLCRRGFPLRNEYRDEDENRMWGGY